MMTARLKEGPSVRAQFAGAPRERCNWRGFALVSRRNCGAGRRMPVGMGSALAREAGADTIISPSTGCVARRERQCRSRNPKGAPSHEEETRQPPTVANHRCQIDPPQARSVTHRIDEGPEVASEDRSRSHQQASQASRTHDRVHEGTPPWSRVPAPAQVTRSTMRPATVSLWRMIPDVTPGTS